MYITAIMNLFNLNRAKPSSPVAVGSDIRLVGYFDGEPHNKTRQVIVRRSAPGTPVTMKKGEGGWELEIGLPLDEYTAFAELVLRPETKECSFDTSAAALSFQIGGSIPTHEYRSV